MGRWPGQLACLALALASTLALRAGYAQPSIQFPTTPPASTVITQPGPAAAVAPGATLAPGGAINPYTGGAVPFDPYSPSGSAAYQFWGTSPPSNTSGVFATPPATPYGSMSPFAPPPATVPVTPAQQYIFPDGIGEGGEWSESLRFIQDLRIRHTWVDKQGDRDLGINDSEAAVTFTWPDFLWGQQPLFISPAFALHLWDGPGDRSADLPAEAYSAYLDFQYATDPKLQLGAELGFRVGVYSDFETWTTDSIRLQGIGLGVLRLTPSCTLKFGVVYIDRNDIKLLPAAGWLYTPNPQVQFDIFFPSPRLSAYCTTINNYEVWWYVAGEYGGGAWTIKRDDDTTDRVDINDIRVSAGLESRGPNCTLFFEAGYVFKRQVVYVETPDDTFNPKDTFMIRAGASF